MTQIDFYILGCSPNESSVFACRLAEKAFQSGHRVHIHARSAAEARELDQQLWTFRAGSFVPHELVEDEAAASDVAITIGADTVPENQTDVLVNLTDTLPPGYQRFRRVAEVVAGSDECKQAARQRYRAYRESGHSVQSHQIDA